MSKVWFITGCSSGLGLAVARAVLIRGDKAAVTACDTGRLQEIVRDYPQQALPLYLNLNDSGSIEQAVLNALRVFGSIDVLVNNAGQGYRAAIEESEAGAIQELFETNFFAPMELIKLLLPQMRRRKRGMIINVSSIGAVRGALGNGYYSAAKGALELASEALAKEVKHLGIRVMVVEPGAFRTGFYGQKLRESRQKIDDYDILAEGYRKGAADMARSQPGNPVKGGELIVETAMAPNPPFRLLLGSDAVKAAEEELQRRLTELHDWEDISRQSDFPTPIPGSRL